MTMFSIAYFIPDYNDRGHTQKKYIREMEKQGVTIRRICPDWSRRIMENKMEKTGKFPDFRKKAWENGKSVDEFPPETIVKIVFLC